MEGYSAKIVNASKELSVRDKIKIKDLTNSVGLDEAVTDDVPLMVTPSLWAELAIHNEKSKDKDYKKYILVDAAGTKYATGSESFWSAFNDNRLSFILRVFVFYYFVSRRIVCRLKHNVFFPFF